MQGKNDRGQLGIGSREARHSPVEVPTPWSPQHALVKIATGKAHTLFLLTNGDVWGCGAASCGQLGLGAGKRALEDCLAPVHLSSLTDIRDISCGAEFSVVCTRSRGQVLTFGHPEVGGSVAVARYCRMCRRHVPVCTLTTQSALLWCVFSLIIIIGD